ncbi:hypothetical protein AeMF1_001672 [Aphanomyces euteiches]|nr:hypothetical protein AeMF1_001672 [Aphanomyces euteiches]KAH9185127.1 hypothetical protein AeNC1_012895 [Aphanomyces euteiches]
MGRDAKLPRLASSLVPPSSSSISPLASWCPNDRHRVDKSALNSFRQSQPQKKTQKQLQRQRRRQSLKPVALSTLDQRILVLYNSKLSRELSTVSPPPPSSSWPPEATHAAQTIQRVLRGHWCRRAIFAFFGPVNQQKALTIQRVYRGHTARVLVSRRRQQIARDAAIRLQAWIRGVLARDFVALLVVRDTIDRVKLLQRVYRGHCGRRRAARVRWLRHMANALIIQRVFRGFQDRSKVRRILDEASANARAIAAAALRHAVSSRCQGCSWSHCTPSSLVRCLLAVLFGSYNLPRAKQLGLDGVTLFPTDAIFPLLVSVVMQLQGDKLELAMVYLDHARRLGLLDSVLRQVETLYFMAALEWQPGNPVVCFAFAVFLASIGNVRRAETYFKQALRASPLEYPLESYFARQALADALLATYKRFLCLVKLPAHLHVKLSTGKLGRPDFPGAALGVRLTRCNHYAVIAPEETQEKEERIRCNAIFIADDELAHLCQEGGQKHGLYRRHRRRQPLKDLALLQEARSTVKLTAQQAELLLNQLVLLLPSVAPDATQGPTYVLVLPRLLRLREQTAWAHAQYEAVVNIQRLYRGHVVRYRKTRLWLCDRIRDVQMQQLQLQLAQRKALRLERAAAATQIQAIYRGVVQRRHWKRMEAAAIVIQAMMRGQLAKRRVEAIRQGNEMQIPVVRVFHRGVDLQGKLLVLTIDHAGLSFRFTGVDFQACCEYTGCCPRGRTLAMIDLFHRQYAADCLGQPIFHLGHVGVVLAVDDTTAAGQIRLWCHFDGPSSAAAASSSRQVSLSLADAAWGIRSALSKRQSSGTPPSAAAASAALFPLPVDPTNINQLVAAMLPHLALVPAMDVPTRAMQLLSRAPLKLAVVPPVAMPLFVPSVVPRPYATMLAMKPKLTPAMVRQLAKPYATRLRLDSSLQLQHAFRRRDLSARISLSPAFPPRDSIFRKQCPRHFTAYARCKCWLPQTKGAFAHVAALEAALSLARPYADKSRPTILTNEIPNPSHRMWNYEKNEKMRSPPQKQ